MDRDEPLVSCVVVFHANHSTLAANETALNRCLMGLQEQRYRDCEVIVVNTSPYPIAEQRLMLENRGYANAVNCGCTAAQGKFLLILNADVYLPHNAIAELVGLLQKQPTAIFSPITCALDGSLDAAGNQMHFTGITSRSKTTQAACTLSGAALFMTRQSWHLLHGLDEDYFLFFEDTDFSLRAMLMGLHLEVCDLGVVVHDSQFKLLPEKFYLLERNRLMMLLKIYQAQTLIKLLPALCLTSLSTLGYALFAGGAFVGAWFKVWAWLWQNRSKLLEKRRAFQKVRRFSDRVFLERTRPELPFMALQPRFAQRLNQLTTPLYRLFFWLAT